mmetsp:Transcript_22487/g.19202  ORF Transcript_22487/g.19202 Transcript_22487/m.19202 type:complete len:92 (-) Transcript_22487:4-279(-)
MACVAARTRKKKLKKNLNCWMKTMGTNDRIVYFVLATTFDTLRRNVISPFSSTTIGLFVRLSSALTNRKPVSVTFLRGHRHLHNRRQQPSS